MSDGQNPALLRASSSKVKRRFWAPPNLESPGGALEAARNAWWGGAWLAVSSVLDAAIGAARYHDQPSLIWIVVAIDAVVLCIGLTLAWVIRSFQPLWAIVVLLVLLSLELIVALIALSIGLGLAINGVLIYVCITAIRGRLRLNAFRRGELTPTLAGKVFE